jgi:hypothetical protein
MAVVPYNKDKNNNSGRRDLKSEWQRFSYNLGVNLITPKGLIFATMYIIFFVGFRLGLRVEGLGFKG